jgi:hypothetical protein
VTCRKKGASRRGLIDPEQLDPWLCHGATLNCLADAWRYHASSMGTPIRLGNDHAATWTRPPTDTTNVAVIKSMQAPPWP